MVKDIYPCNKKELEKILEDNNYFKNKENSWRNIIHKKFCIQMTRKGELCLTKIKDSNQEYCKHHMKKDYFILCSYNNCKIKCSVWGDFCHNHRKYYCNNINYIEDDIFNYDIFKKYNKVNEWNRYINWNNYKKQNLLINMKITIIEYMNYSYCSENNPIILYFDYKKYIHNILIKIYKQLKKYCIKNNWNIQIVFFVLNTIYNFYQSSYFEKFNKNIESSYVNNNDNFNKDEKINELENNEIKIMNIEKQVKKNKKKNKKKKEKTVQCLYNIFNDKIKNFISNDYSKFSQQESKYIRNLINNTLNENKIKYKDNINLFIYNSSINIYDKIEKYIEKEIYHDIDIFNKMLRNVFINYKIFAIITDIESTEEDIKEWRPKLEKYIFDILKNF